MGATIIHVQGTDIEQLIGRATDARMELQLDVVSDVEIVKRALVCYVDELEGTLLHINAMKSDL